MQEVKTRRRATGRNAGKQNQQRCGEEKEIGVREMEERLWGCDKGQRARSREAGQRR